MTLAQWIDPSDDDVVTVDGTEITAIADKSLQGNDVAGITPASLLANFDGADAATSYTSEDQHAQAAIFVADAQLDTAQKKFGASSLFLDGTGDYLIFPDRPEFNFGANSFTVECWVRFNGDPGSGLHAIIAQHNPGANNRSWELRLQNNGLEWAYSSNGTDSFFEQTAWNPVGSQWYHLAVTADGTNLRMFVDGSLLATIAHTNVYHNVPEPLTVGSIATGTRVFSGWIDDVRIINGAALYTAAFTAPTAALGEDGIGPEEVTVDSKRAMDFAAGGSLVALNDALTNMDGPDFTVIAAFSDDNASGEDNGIVSMSDSIRVGNASGWRMGKPDAATPVEVSIGNEANNLVQINDAVFDGVASLALDSANEYMIGHKNGLEQGTDIIVPPLTALLANFDGADAATSYTSEDAGARVATFAGDAQLDTAQKKFGSASVLFDGTGDYLEFPDSADFDFLGDDFTVECWVRFNAVTGQQVIMAKWDWTGAPSQGSWLLRHDDGTNNLKWTYSPNGISAVTVATFSWSPSTATWYHVAASRSNDVIYLFVDGVLLGSAAFTATMFASTATLRVGGYQDDLNPTEPLNGWVDDVRLIKGAGLYTEDFAPPTVANTDRPWNFTDNLAIGFLPGGANWVDGNIYEIVYADGLLRTDERQRVEGYLAHKWALHGNLPTGHPFKDSPPDIVEDSALVANLDGADAATSYTSDDSTGRVATFVGTAQLDTAQKKFGTASLLVDGNSDWITFPDDAAWDLAGGDFTVECWVRHNTNGNIQGYVAHYNSQTSNASWILRFDAAGGGSLQFITSSNGSATATLSSSVWTPTNNTWYHLAAVRRGNNLRMYIDGVAVYDAAFTTTLFSNAEPLDIGVIHGGAGPVNYMDGWIDSVRVTSGTALYLHDFDPPHREFVIPAPAAFTGNFNGDDAAVAYTSEDAGARVCTFIADAQLDTAQKKFGVSSMKFDGTGDVVTFPDSADFDFGNGDFTIECWIRFNGDPGTGDFTMMAKTTTVGSQQQWTWALTNNFMRLNLSTTGADNTTNDQAWNPAGDTWIHIAVERFSDNLYHYADGVQLGTEISYSSTLFANTPPFNICGVNTGSYIQLFSGWIDGLQIVKGHSIRQGAGTYDVPIDAPGEPIT